MGTAVGCGIGIPLVAVLVGSECLLRRERKVVMGLQGVKMKQSTGEHRNERVLAGQQQHFPGHELDGVKEPKELPYDPVMEHRS